MRGRIFLLPVKAFFKNTNYWAEIHVIITLAVISEELIAWFVV